MRDLALPTTGPGPIDSGDEAAGATTRLAFAPGWDRQDRWLRFVDPVLEHAYREAMTVPARRRFRVAVAVGCLFLAIVPVLDTALVGTTPGGDVIAVVIAIAGGIASIIWAGRVGLRGIWALDCVATAIVAVFPIVANGVVSGTFFELTALALALLGIFQIGWVRVAWWVAAGMCLVGIVLFMTVGLMLQGDRGTTVYQGIVLAMILGGATLGSRFLEAAERRSFAQGLLVDHLFRQYLSPDVAEALVENPARAELGGEVVEVSVLFADLRGYTPFSEGRSPADVVAMLNAAFGAAVPAVFAEGGTVVQFVGDALMAIFNAPLRQPDHALRACRAGLALQAAVPASAGANGRPRFRVGINTGPALVGNIGSAELRNFSALGDTTNTAARLQTYAPEGSVVIGERTYELVREGADVRALGSVELKGKATATPVYELVGLNDSAGEVGATDGVPRSPGPTAPPERREPDAAGADGPDQTEI